MSKPPLRTALVVAAVAFAIGAPAFQAMTDFGLSPSEFSSKGDETLRAAGYAFSIWGVIYAGLAFYAVWQALPRTAESPLLRAVAWPSIVGIAGCGLWILVSAQDWRWASVAVILVSAAAIIAALWRAAPERAFYPEGSRAALWPLGLLGGWLTAASALNVLTSATADGLIGAGQATAAAIVGLAAVVAIAGGVLVRTRSLPYALAIVWALVAVGVAEQNNGPVVLVGAFCAASVVGLMLVLRRRRD